MSAGIVVALFAATLGHEPAPPCTGVDLSVPRCTPQGGCHMVLEPYQPQPGDLVLFRFNGITQNILYCIFFAGHVTHAGIVVARPDGSLGILEAPGIEYPVMFSDIPTRCDFFNGKVWVRRRRAPLTPEQSACLTAYACAQEGKPFHLVGVLRPTMDHPSRKVRGRCLGCRDLHPSRWFCSSLVAACLVAVGELDPCLAKPRSTDPEDLFSDTSLDLSCGWEPPRRVHRPGPRRQTWFSQTSQGCIQCWK